MKIQGFFLVLWYKTNSLELYLFIKNTLYLFFVGFSFLFLFGCNNRSSSNNQVATQDSITVWVQNSKKEKLSFQERRDALSKAYAATIVEKEDTIKSKNYRKVAFAAYKLGDSLLFKKINNEARSFSEKIKDTFTIADTYWNEGLFYAKRERQELSYFAYTEAYNNYEAIKNDFYAARMLCEMAIVLKDIRDYTGSEITAFQAIQKLDKNNSKHQLYLYKCHNVLGVIYHNLKEFDRALEHHDKALGYLNNVENKKTYREASFNNKGLVYQGQKKYGEAIDYYKKALENGTKLYSIKPKFYAKVLDNLNYTRFLKEDTIDVEKALLNALKIRESLKDLSGVVINKLHLSEYYFKYKDSNLAKRYAKEAYQLAVNTDNNRDALGSLSILSKIDKKSSNNHLSEYIRLSQKLQTKDRNIRDKFTRIRYNTDEYKAEIASLSSQQKYIIVIALSLILISILLYINRHQRAKNKELTLEREQQLANEEIYQLMLRQQTKLEEGRLKERHRISEELHDGVLGKIFGTRMGLGFLGFKGNPEEKDKHQYYIDELQEIEKEIRIISHELKNEILGTNVDYIKIIEDLVEEQSKISIFKYSIVQDGNIQWSAISDIIKINIYRTVQEALQNINKHANANLVSFEFLSVADQIKVIIEDDGVGFDQTKKANGIGLKNIISRVTKLKGTFTIESKPDNGTVLTICVPI